jgi:nitrogenase molybdenum-iron protein alpha/beta subunit
MGAALALLGMGNTVPLMLGARGCAMVGLIQLNRHF